MKRLTAILTIGAVAAALAVSPCTCVYASGTQESDDGQTIAKTGKCGDNATFSLADDDTVIISGTGAIYESRYGYEYLHQDWSDLLASGKIKKVIIEEGPKGSHHYTTDKNEYKTLAGMCGWNGENVAWYGLS